MTATAASSAVDITSTVLSESTISVLKATNTVNDFPAPPTCI
jgi:hypothetical protein